MHDAAIADFATHLVPEAFARRHTAHRVDLVTDVPSGHEAFDDWVTARLAEAVVDRYAAGGTPVRFIVVEGGDGIRWRWDESVCCRPSWFATKVRGEAAEIPTPWVFAVELHRPDVRIGEAISFPDAPTPDDDPAWQATWYAEGRGRGVATIRAGEVDLVAVPDGRSDRVTGQRDIPHRGSAVAAYHQVLRRHPARAAHHLRRR